MRKTTIVLLILATVLVLAGAIFFVGEMIMLKWDFSKLSTAKYETNTQTITEDFIDIDIKTIGARVTLLPSEDDECSVVCYERKNVKHTVFVLDSKLMIEAKDERKWYDYININFKTPTITLYLPKATYDTLSISTGTGDVTIPKAFSFDKIAVTVSTGNIKNYASATDAVSLNATTGDITVDSLSVGALSLSVSTGHVTVSNVACAGDMTLNVSTGKANLSATTCQTFASEGSTGDISLRDVTIKGDSSIKRSTGDLTMTDVTSTGSITANMTTGKVHLARVTCKNLTSKANTGDITLRDTVATETFSIERSTGDVTFERADAASIYVLTDTGDVKGSLRTPKVFITKTDTGRIDVPDSATGGRCEITTDTGNITMTISDAQS